MASRSYPRHDQALFSFSNAQNFDLRSSRRQQQQQQQHSGVSLPHPGSAGSNPNNSNQNIPNSNSNNGANNSNNSLNDMNFPPVSSQLEDSGISHRQLSRHLNTSAIPALEDLNAASAINQIRSQRSYQQPSDSRSDSFQQQLQRQQLQSHKQQQQQQHHLRGIRHNENRDDGSNELYSDAQDRKQGENTIVSAGRKRSREDDQMTSGQQMPVSNLSQNDEYKNNNNNNNNGESEPGNQRAGSISVGTGGKNSRGSYSKWSAEQTRVVFDSLVKAVRDSDSEVRWSFNSKILEAVTEDLIAFNQENNIPEHRTIPTLISAVKHHIRNTKDKYVTYATLGSEKGVMFNDDGWLVCGDPLLQKRLKPAKYFREAFPVKRQIETMLRERVELQESLKITLGDEDGDEDHDEPNQLQVHSLNNNEAQNQQDNNQSQDDLSEKESGEMDKMGSNGIHRSRGNDFNTQNKTGTGSSASSRSILNQPRGAGSFNAGSNYQHTAQHLLQQQQQNHEQNQSNHVGIHEISGPLPMLNMNVNGMNNLNASGDVGTINNISSISNARPSPISNVSRLNASSSAVLNRNMNVINNRVNNPLQMSSIDNDDQNRGILGAISNSSDQGNNRDSVSLGSDTNSSQQQQQNSTSRFLNSGLRTDSSALPNAHAGSSLGSRLHQNQGGAGANMNEMGHLSSLNLLNNIDNIARNVGDGSTRGNLINHNQKSNTNSISAGSGSSGVNNSTLNQMIEAVSPPSSRNAAVSRVNPHSSYRHSNFNSGSISNPSSGEQDAENRNRNQDRAIDESYRGSRQGEVSDISTYFLLKYPLPSHRGVWLTVYFHCDPRGREIMEAANKHPSRQKFDCLESICLLWANEFINELKNQSGYDISQINFQHSEPDNHLI